jgi:hypothetical protein
MKEEAMGSPIPLPKGMLQQFKPCAWLVGSAFSSSAYGPGRIGTGDQLRFRCPEFPTHYSLPPTLIPSFSGVQEMRNL